MPEAEVNENVAIVPAEAVKLVEETLVEETVPKMPVLVTESEPMPRFPDPVAFVNVIPVEEVSVVAMIVAAWKLLEPVALVKVKPVEEATLVT